MRIKFKGEKERYRFLVMAILLAGCCFLTYYFHTAISTGKFVTHAYYIPIILAALWWKRKGLAVAIFFAAWLIFSHFFIRPGEETIFDFFRAAMFVTVGFITVILREQIDKQQRKIKREKNFSENIITTVPDSLIVVDKALRIKKANLSFYQVFGLKPEYVEGTRITDLLGDEDGKLSTELTRLIGTKTAIENLEINYHSEKLGERVLHIAARGIIVAEEAAEEEEVLIVLGDITHRKQMEESLRKSHDELERRVDERTAELKKVNEQLKQEIEEHKQMEKILRREEVRLETLLRMGEMSEVSLTEIAGFTLDQGISLTDSSIGFLGFLSEDESIYTLHAVSRNLVKECKVAGDPMQWDVSEAGIWADAIRQRKTLFVNDYAKPYPSKKGLPEGHLSLNRFMVVPVFEGKRIVAMAGVGNKTSDYGKDDERQLTLLMKSMWNYVQRNQAKKALRKSEENFRNIFQSIPEPVLSIDNQFKVLNSNKAFAELIRKYATELNMSENELREKIISELRKNFGKTEQGLIEIERTSEK